LPATTCASKFRRGFKQVKLYFLCGLPGERRVDLEGIVEMSETISRIGREELGHPAKVTASVSNFVPKPHTPYQWDGMQTEAYLTGAHNHLHRWRTVRAVQLKCHDTPTSLLEGVLTRGDRRVADVVELAWRRGARLDSWHEHFIPDRWWRALADCGLDLESTAHRAYPLDARLPWDHLNVRKGRTFLEKEHERAVQQLTALAGAV